MVRKRSAKARVLLTSSSSSSSSSSDDEGGQEVSAIAGDGGDGSGSDADAGGAQVGSPGSSSSEDSSTSSHGSSSCTSDGDLSDEELRRREVLYEKQRKRESGRKYVNDCAGEGNESDDEDDEDDEDSADEDDEDDDDDDDDQDNNDSVEDGSTTASPLDSGGKDGLASRDAGKNVKDRRRKKKEREDFSFLSNYASIREIDREMDDMNESEDYGLLDEGEDNGMDETGSDDAQPPGSSDGVDGNDGTGSHDGRGSDGRGAQRGEDGGTDDENWDGENDGEDDDNGDDENDGEDEEDIVARILQDDPNCCNRWERNLVVVNMEDIQCKKKKRRGYVYCLTSPAESGPALTTITLKQLFVFLHVIFSPIPESCVVDTDWVKYTKDAAGFVEKVQQVVEMTDEEAAAGDSVRRQLGSMALSDMPFDTAFVGNRNLEGCDDGDAGDCMSDTDGRLEDIMSSGKGRFKLQITDAADILISPVCVTYVVDDSLAGRKGSRSGKRRAANKKQRIHPRDGSGSGNSSFECDAEDGSWNADDSDDSDDDVEADVKKTSVSVSWVVWIVTKNGYNFTKHVHSLVSAVEKDDKNGLKKTMNKEYDDVMNILREVILYQYEQSPNAISFFRSQGVGSRIDPLQRLTEICTPDSLDHVCSVYEAYRSIIFQVLKEDSRRKIVHVSGFSETMPMTPCMFAKSLATQQLWHKEFNAEKTRLADRHKEIASKQAAMEACRKGKNVDAEECAALQFEIQRLKDTETKANLPEPVLYPILEHDSDSMDVDDDDLKDGLDDGFFDEYEQGQDGDHGDGPGKQVARRALRSGDGEMHTGIPNLKLVMRVDIQGRFGRDKTFLNFVQKFGNLPQEAMYQMTDMMYQPSSATNVLGRASVTGYFNLDKDHCRRRHRQAFVPVRCKRGHGESGSGGGDGDPLGCMNVGLNDVDRKTIFLPKPKLVNFYSRKEMFGENEGDMNGFKCAGCHSDMYKRMMKVVASSKDPVEKILLFDDYLGRVIRQHISSVLNNDLRSHNALFAVKYIEQARFTVCDDLRKLIKKVGPLSTILCIVACSNLIQSVSHR